MKINHLDTFVIGDGPDVDPDRGGLEPLACPTAVIAWWPTEQILHLGA